MLKEPIEPEALAEGSSPSLPASSSSAVMAALIAEHAETRALCAHVASSIISNAASTCGSRGAIAAAFTDLAALAGDHVGDVLRGKTC